MMNAQETIRDLDLICMELGARLTMLHATTIKGHDYLLRDAVMREVVEWRRMWDKNSAARAKPIERGVMNDAEIRKIVINVTDEIFGEDAFGEDATRYTEEDAKFYGALARAILATQSTDAGSVRCASPELTAQINAAAKAGHFVFEPGWNEPLPITQPLIAEAARDDECIELAQALEQARAVKIAERVAALPIGGATNNMPTPFQAGFQLACEEITHRLRTEEWDLCLKPIGAGTPSFNQAEFDMLVEKGTKAWAGHAIKRDDVAGDAKDAARLFVIFSELPLSDFCDAFNVAPPPDNDTRDFSAWAKAVIDSHIAAQRKDAP